MCRSLRLGLSLLLLSIGSAPVQAQNKVDPVTVTAVTFLPDGRRALFASLATARLWDLDTDREVPEFVVDWHAGVARRRPDRWHSSSADRHSIVCVRRAGRGSA
jgi:hypothetical protein